MRQFTKEWFIAAMIRAIHTFAQTALSFITIGLAFTDIDWMTVLSVAGVAAVYSILKSIVLGTPEAEYDGALLVDDSGESTKWLLQVGTPVEEINKLQSIRLKVDPNAKLNSDE